MVLFCRCARCLGGWFILSSIHPHKRVWTGTQFGPRRPPMEAFVLKSSLFLIISCLPLYPEVATTTQGRDAYAKLPLSFEENKGQTDPQVKYLTRGPGYILYLTGKEIVLASQDYFLASQIEN